MSRLRAWAESSDPSGQWDLRDLAGSFELARVLGISPATISHWSTRGGDGVPQPKVTLVMGRLFSYQQVTSWFRREIRTNKQRRSSMKRFGHVPTQMIRVPPPYEAKVNPALAGDDLFWDLSDLIGNWEMQEELMMTEPQINARCGKFPEPLVQFQIGKAYSRRQVAEWYKSTQSDHLEESQA